ncbi:monocarboxylate transporter 7-like [Anticarsia gemmatalis]|uniref:monocarboxylate transporter 7-like n=1 Tax=Anticarsia gemmatalis TaxID=129554 RepID=UPI003F76FE9F
MANTAPNKPNGRRKSILIVPSRIAEAPTDDLDGIEETEIAAEISVPSEGGWGWVVVAGSFYCTFIIDGIFFTFGTIYPDITEDMGIESTFVALINSVAVALYFIIGPLTSALINRFGFRACTMAGSVIASIAYLCSYFATTYLALLMFYGVIAGFAGCLISMPSAIIVGFYFERLRALALSLAGSGSSVGIMIMSIVNAYLINLAGWRITTLFHSGLFGSIYFISMVYRPLLSITVAKTTDDPTRTVTYLPSLMAPPPGVRASPSKARNTMPTAAERMFSAVSNAHFPTAASVVEEGVIAQPTTQAGPSSGAGVSKLTITARSPQGGISRRQLKQVQSMVSRASVQDSDKKNVEVTVQMPQEPRRKKRGFCARLCQWEEHITESRPMYRDDAFYAGKLEKLPAYQKSMMDTAPEARTGLEYQMAVSRAVTTADLGERTGVFTTAARRILATMMNPQLLRRCSFLLICFGGFLTYVGLLVPYVFLPDRNRSEGIDPQHCNLFLSVIGLCNAIGRLIAGALACKYNALMLYEGAAILAGIGAMLFNLSFNLYYQYFCCVFFGMFVASISSLRSAVLVDLYGLDMLTNATGMLLMFQGFGSLIGPPLSSILKGIFGYAVSFYAAGAVISLSGFVILPVQKLVNKENNKNVTPKKPKKPAKK